MRRAALRNDTVVHDDDLVAHRERFILVVRHIGHREPQPLLQRSDLLAHLPAQARVQIGQRLVEQQDRRFQHQRPGQRNPLLLAARQFRGLPLVEADQPDAAQRLLRALPRDAPGHPRHLEAVADVVEHVQVGEQRVALEHHADVAVRGAQRRHVLAPDQDLARRRCFEAGDHPQRGGLAAARRPQDGRERAAPHLETDCLDCERRRGVPAIALADAPELDAGAGVAHAMPLLVVRVSRTMRLRRPSLRSPTANWIMAVARPMRMMSTVQYAKATP